MYKKGTTIEFFFKKTVFKQLIQNLILLFDVIYGKEKLGSFSEFSI